MTVAAPFKPMRGANQKVTASTTSATITCGKGNRSLRIINAGSQVAYFRTYQSSPSDGASTTATAGDTPIAVSGAAGSVLIIEKQPEHDLLAYIADSATTVMHFQPGEAGC